MFSPEEHLPARAKYKSIHRESPDKQYLQRLLYLHNVIMICHRPFSVKTVSAALSKNTEN